jgi:hypothetical protein
MRTILALMVLGLLIAAAPAAAQPPPEWSLQQNDPNPFCNNPGVTAIRFTAPQAAEVRLEIWSPDTTQVVRALVHGILNAGQYEVVWDGKDGMAALLPRDSYPYSLTAFDAFTGGFFFSDMRVAEISCVSPTVPDTWGRVKAIYRG